MATRLQSIASITSIIARLSATTPLNNPTPLRVKILVDRVPTYNSFVSNFFEVGSGINIGGCSASFLYRFVDLAFSPGDTLFVAAKARKGKLERVTIKQAIIHDLPDESATAASNFNALLLSTATGERPITYIDWLNGIWIESELISHSDALALAIAYQQNLLDKYANISNCALI